MYSVNLRLPKSLSEEQIFVLSESLNDISLSFSLKDEGNLWLACWVSGEEFKVEDFLSRLEIQSKLHQIALTIANDDWEIEKLPDVNWLEETYRDAPSFSVGPFFIHNAHDKGTVPEEQIGICIDAVTAFGNGQHATTKTCLLAMADLKDQGACPWNVLDLGTGTGILAIAAWKLWKTPVLATDNDSEACHSAAAHFDMNGISPSPGSCQCVLEDGLGGGSIQKRGPFDLIMANILAGALIDMAPQFKTISDENGYVILSGILSENEQNVLSAFEQNDFAFYKRYSEAEWSTLVLHNQAR